jgi:hypothetical protein
MTVKERILNAHATKTLDEALLELSLLKDGKPVASGEGKLTISVNGRLQIEVNAETIPFNFDFSSRGTIISEKEFFEITAKTRDNLTFRANRLYAKNISRSIDEPAHALFEPAQVTFLLNATPQPHSSFDVFIPPFDIDFYNQHSTDGIMNPVYGDNVPGPWLSVETAETVVGLRKDSDSWIHLKLKSKTTDTSNLEKYAIAFLNALRFHVGTYLECLAYSYTTAEGEAIILNNHKLSGQRKFYAPLPNHEIVAAEKLLICGMNFFLKKSCSPVVTALCVCWESRKVTFLAGNLLVCSVVEGLADYILTDANEQYAKLRDLALDLLRKEPKAKESIYLEAFEKCIKSVEFIKSKESIRKAGELLKITITQTELKAWGHLRHRLAHGNFSIDFKSPATVQSEFDHAASVANIVNKFVLALFQYEGVFCDYSVRGHPTRNFPISQPGYGQT